MSGAGKKQLFHVFRVGLLFIPFLFLAGCVSQLQIFPLHDADTALYRAAPDYTDALLNQFAPVFIVEKADQAYNRIGTPSARIEKGRELIFIDADNPAAYVQKSEFQTPRDRYTNLIYRTHFSEVPSGLSRGRNVGLLVVVTLNSSGVPVLLTTVNTCGCYLAIMPLSTLPEDAYPTGWTIHGQSVYGEYLPGLIPYKPENNGTGRFLLLLRDKTHRVKGVWFRNDSVDVGGESVLFPLKSMTDLEKLPFGNDFTSFFEQHGPRKGYVKGSFKPYEKMFISWWAFDWNVGEDKAYGPRDKTGTIFYTSLKFWARDESDMWDFAGFLRYWGWNL